MIIPQKTTGTVKTCYPRQTLNLYSQSENIPRRNSIYLMRYGLSELNFLDLVN